MLIICRIKNLYGLENKNLLKVFGGREKTPKGKKNKTGSENPTWETMLAGGLETRSVSTVFTALNQSE